MPYKDPEKLKQYKQQWQQRNKERHRISCNNWRKKHLRKARLSSRISQVKRRKNPKIRKQMDRASRLDSHKKQQWINNYKVSQGCKICGLNDLPCLDFHHKNPKEKEFLLAGANQGFSRIMKEVEKCVVLCANCHRKLHYYNLEIQK